MTAAALALVVAAAFVHATWNLLAKRAGSGGPAFVWLVAAIGATLYAPLALGLLLWQRPALGAPELGFMAGSAALHVGYFLLLQRGYRSGDLSLVYPLARGSGPALATAAAIAFFGERPGGLAVLGALLVVGGVVGLTLGQRPTDRAAARPAVAHGLSIGVLIAGYTLWDNHAVAVLLVPPLLLDWGSNVGRAALLAPLALRLRAEVRAVWATHRREVLGVALLSPLSYLLVLTALVTTPVSYVAPARELSIVIATAMGTRLLAEGHSRRRLGAAAVIVAGVVALALG